MCRRPEPEGPARLPGRSVTSGALLGPTRAQQLAGIADNGGIHSTGVGRTLRVTPVPQGGVGYPKSTGEFMAWFPADEDCLDYLESRLARRTWSACNYAGGWRLADGRFWCAGCDSRTSVTAGTIFDRTRTPLTVWFNACWLFATQKDGVSALSLQRALEIGCPPDGLGDAAPAALGAGAPRPRAPGRHGGGRRDLHRRRGTRAARRTAEGQEVPGRRGGGAPRCCRAGARPAANASTVSQLGAQSGSGVITSPTVTPARALRSRVSRRSCPAAATRNQPIRASHSPPTASPASAAATPSATRPTPRTAPARVAATAARTRSRPRHHSSAQDPAAVERRPGQQVEDREDQVDPTQPGKTGQRDAGFAPRRDAEQR